MDALSFILLEPYEFQIIIEHVKQTCISIGTKKYQLLDSTKDKSEHKEQKLLFALINFTKE